MFYDSCPFKQAKNCGTYPKSNDKNLLKVLKGLKHIEGNACLLAGESYLSHESFMAALPPNIKTIYVCDINISHLQSLKNTFGNQQGRRTLHYVHIDLFSLPECQQLSNIISEKKHSLGLLNLTNIHQYDRDKKLVKNLAMLPLAKQHAFIYSRTGDDYFSLQAFRCTSFATRSLKALRFFLSLDSCLTEQQLIDTSFAFLQPLRNITEPSVEKEILQTICGQTDQLTSLYLRKFIYIHLFLSDYIDREFFFSKLNLLFKPDICVSEIEKDSPEKIIAQCLLMDFLKTIEEDYFKKKARIHPYRKKTTAEFEKKIKNITTLLEAYELLYDLKKNNLEHHLQHGSCFRFWKGLTQSRFCTFLDDYLQKNVFEYHLLAPKNVKKSSSYIHSFTRMGYSIN